MTLEGESRAFSSPSGEVGGGMGLRSVADPSLPLTPRVVSLASLVALGKSLDLSLIFFHLFNFIASLALKAARKIN